MSAISCHGCQGTQSVRDIHSGEMRPCLMCRAADYEAWCAALRPRTRRVAALDQRGRCCGRKPITYRRERRLFCDRCNASFDTDTGRQAENWAWRADGDAFIATHPTAELARLDRMRVNSHDR